MLIKILKSVTSGSRSDSLQKPNLFCSLGFLLDYDSINFYNLPSQSPQSWQRERHELNKRSRSWSFSSSHRTTTLICKGQKDQHPELVNVCWTQKLPSAEWHQLPGGSPFIDCAPRGKRGAGSPMVTGSRIILGANLKCRFLTITRNPDFSGCI